jgi:hypothetical protein
VRRHSQVMVVVLHVRRYVGIEIWDQNILTLLVHHDLDGNDSRKFVVRQRLTDGVTLFASPGVDAQVIPCSCDSSHEDIPHRILCISNQVKGWNPVSCY